MVLQVDGSGEGDVDILLVLQIRQEQIGEAWKVSGVFQLQFSLDACVRVGIERRNYEAAQVGGIHGLCVVWCCLDVIFVGQVWLEVAVVVVLRVEVGLKWVHSAISGEFSPLHKKGTSCEQMEGNL